MYVPAPHAVQPLPTPQKPVLHIQSVSALLAGGASEFAGHSRHSSLEAAPTVVEYVPVVQLLHDASPCVALYVPVAQSEQCPPSGPVAPAVHAHAMLPPGESEFAGHTAHGPPSGPVEPALQVHAVELVLPKNESVYIGHSRHADTFVAPTNTEYVPGGHAVHDAAPVALYFPAAHAVHVPPSGPVQPATHVHAPRVVLSAGERVLSGHAEQFTVPPHEYVSATQAPHVLLVRAPAMLECLPGTHAVHSADPGSALCVPAAHNTHVPPSGPVEPALHAHAVSSELPVSELEFVGQAEHTDAVVAPTSTA